MDTELSNEIRNLMQRAIKSSRARDYEDYFNHVVGKCFEGAMRYLAEKKSEDIEIYSVLPSSFYISKWQTISYIRGYFPVKTRIVFKNQLPVGLITKEISGHFSCQTYVSTEPQSFKSEIDALLWVYTQVEIIEVFKILMIKKQRRCCRGIDGVPNYYP